MHRLRQKDEVEAADALFAIDLHARIIPFARTRLIRVVIYTIRDVESYVQGHAAACCREALEHRASHFFCTATVRGYRISITKKTCDGMEPLALKDYAL